MTLHTIPTPLMLDRQASMAQHPSNNSTKEAEMDAAWKKREIQASASGPGDVLNSFGHRSS